MPGFQRRLGSGPVIDGSVQQGGPAGAVRLDLARDGFAQVVPQMPPVADLRRAGQDTADGQGVGRGAVEARREVSAASIAGKRAPARRANSAITALICLVGRVVRRWYRSRTPDTCSRKVWQQPHVGHTGRRTAHGPPPVVHRPAHRPPSAGGSRAHAPTKPCTSGTPRRPGEFVPAPQSANPHRPRCSMTSGASPKTPPGAAPAPNQPSRPDTGVGGAACSSTSVKDAPPDKGAGVHVHGRRRDARSIGLPGIRLTAIRDPTERCCTCPSPSSPSRSPP